ncbi:hypothetical protein [Chryseobacterium proteolyticum]|uniref:hypothetical protein n=1 Tax=Chryseobacterium proteolyticum TaxID=118127 RepID=UPI003983D2D9
MKWQLQNFIILLIIDGLKNTSYGKGIRELYNITITRGPEQSKIEFCRKDGKDIDFVDFFMMALMINWNN